MKIGQAARDEGLLWARICKGKKRGYSVCEDGTVMSTALKNYSEKALKPYLKRGKATVKVNNGERAVKNLVAKYFVDGYRPGDYVETVDGNPWNCAAKNLRLYTQREHGQRTGHRSRAKRIIANGIEYRSIRECAKALHVSYQTLLDYLNGGVKHSVLQGITVERVEA